MKRWFALALAAAVYVILLRAPIPPAVGVAGELIPLPAAGRNSLAVVMVCVILWITEALPFPVTALISFLLLPLTGVATLNDAVSSGLGHPVILFFLSLFLLAAAFSQVGLSRRVARWLLLRSHGDARLLLLLTLSAGALLAMCMTALAATALLVVMAQGMLAQSGLADRRTNVGRALLLAASLGPIIGGVGTPAGAGGNALVVGYLRELAHFEISFVGWMRLGLPIVVVLIPLAWLILQVIFPPEQKRILAPEAIARLVADHGGAMTAQEWRFLAVLGTTSTLWISGPAIAALTAGRVALSTDLVGLAAAVCLFLPGMELVSWRAVERDVQWGTLLVLAAGLAGGVMLYRNGAARWLAWSLMRPAAGAEPVAQVLLVIAMVMVLRLLLSSATAGAAILIPLVIALAQDLALPAWWLVAPAAFSVELAVLFPAQAASHLVSYATGHFTGRDMAKTGVFLSAAAVFVIAAVALLLGR